MATPPTRRIPWLPILYLVFGVLWILASDAVVGWMFGTSPRLLLLVSTAKGFAFVALTALILVARWRAEQKRAAESRNLLQSVIDASAAPVYAYDRAGRCLLMNEACARIVGCPRDAAIGRTREEFMSAADVDLNRAGRRARLPGRRSDRDRGDVGEGADQRTFLSVRYPLRDLARRDLRRRRGLHGDHRAAPGAAGSDRCEPAARGNRRDPHAAADHGTRPRRTGGPRPRRHSCRPFRTNCGPRSIR